MLVVNALYMKKTEKLMNNNYNIIKMNKVWKVVALVGNVSEILIATTMIANLFNKIRGNRKATTTIKVEETNPQPDQTIAA